MFLPFFEKIKAWTAHLYHWRLLNLESMLQHFSYHHAILFAGLRHSDGIHYDPIYHLNSLQVRLSISKCIHKTDDCISAFQFLNFLRLIPIFHGWIIPSIWFNIKEISYMRDEAGWRKSISRLLIKWFSLFFWLISEFVL